MEVGMAQVDSFGARRSLDLGTGTFEAWSVRAVPGAEELPFSLKSRAAPAGESRSGLKMVRGRP
jgi:hypothetical protein